MGSSVRSAPALGFTLALLPSLALAAPLNPFDPTLRTILVEFEISNDPAVFGTTYSAPSTASYSATGSTGTLSMPGAVYESVVPLLHSFGFPLIPSSSDDFVVSIDLITLGASVQPLTYQVDIDVQVSPRSRFRVRSADRDAECGGLRRARRTGRHLHELLEGG